MEFNFFDMNDFKKKSTTLITGARRTGKSTLCLDIIRYKLFNMNSGLIFAKNEDPYSDIYPDIPIYSIFDSSKIYELLQIQKKNSNKEKLVIIDDVLFDENDKNLKELICDGSYLNITTIIILQFPFFTTSEIKSHIRYTFLFYLGNYLLDRIFKYYDLEKEKSKRIFEALKTRFNCCLISNNIYMYCVEKNFNIK